MPPSSSPRHREERETKFRMDEVRNVMPIIDRGETVDHWVLIMPRAEYSLREFMRNHLPVEEAVGVLMDVATALVDLDNSVVHRDIKPENILRPKPQPALGGTRSQSGMPHPNSFGWNALPTGRTSTRSASSATKWSWVTIRLGTARTQGMTCVTHTYRNCHHCWTMWTA